MATRNPRQQPPSPGYEQLYDILIRAVSRIGISGTVVISIIVIFFGWGTTDQKRYFIDKFVLLKTTQDDKAYLLYILFIAIIAFAFTHKYYRDRLKIKDYRIHDLEEQLDEMKVEFKALRKEKPKP